MFGSQWFANPASGFDTTLIGNSVWLDGSADYLTKTWGSAGNRTRWTMAWWFQLNAIATDMTFFSANDGTSEFYIRMDGTSNQNMTIVDSSASMNVNTTAMQRDTAWYHCIISYDSNEGAEADRISIYINGVAMALTTAGDAYPSSGGETYWNNDQANEIGRRSRTTSSYANAYMTQICFLDGQSIQNSDVTVASFLDTQTFGDNGSQKIPKEDSSVAALATAAEGNSFCLDFANSSALGNDISDEENDFTPSSMAAANQSVNTPSLTYPTFNQLTNIAGVSFLTGNTSLVSPNSESALGTLAIPDGSWYWEVKYTGGSGSGSVCGISTFDFNTNTELGYNSPTSPSSADVRIIYLDDGKKGYGVSASGNFTTYGSGQSTDSYVGIAVTKSGTSWKIWFSESGTYPDSGNPATAANPAYDWTSVYDYTFAVGDWSSGDKTVEAVMVSDDWQGTAPTNFLSLSSGNFTAPSYQGIDYFNTILYAGNGTAIGSGGKAVTGTGFQPDLVWIKNRDQTDEYGVYDAVRGTTKQIESDNNAAESTESEGLTAFGSDGFTVGSLAQLNTNTENFVPWQWLGGNATSTDENGSIDSTVSVADAGHFSIVTWEGSGANATVGHGMAGAPTMVLTKDRDVVSTWLAWHEGLTSAQYFLNLDTNVAEFDNGASGYYRGTAPSSTVITMNGSTYNTSGSDLVAYCFRSIAGVCKVGAYTGNNSVDGPFVYTGFKVAYVLIKNTAGTNNWFVFDAARDTYNPVVRYLQPNDNAAGASGSGTRDMDFLSNGFKFRENDSDTNGTTRYIYLAMADIGGGGTLPPIYGR